MKKGPEGLCLLVLLISIFSTLHITQALIWNGYSLSDIEFITNSLAEVANWKTPGGLLNADKFFSCATLPFLGGPLVFSTTNSQISRTYTGLPSHNSLRFSLFVVLLDIWNQGDNIDIKFDSQTVSYQTTMVDFSQWASKVSYCGGAANDLVIHMMGRVIHTGSTLTVTIINKRVTPSSQGSFIFKNFYMLFSQDILANNLPEIMAYPTGENVITTVYCPYYPFNTHEVRCETCTGSPPLQTCGPARAFHHYQYCWVNPYATGTVTNCTNPGPCTTTPFTVPIPAQCIDDWNTIQPGSFNGNCDNVNIVNSGLGFNGCQTSVANVPVILDIPDRHYCAANQYYDSGDMITPCKNCDQSCSQCYGPGDTQCLACYKDLGYFYDGTRCLKCHADCTVCHGPNDNQCDYCTVPKYLWGNKCISCDPPLIKSPQGATTGLGYCIYPCKDSEYLYDDGTCLALCHPQMTSTTTDGKKYCRYPCTMPTPILFYDGCRNQACLFPLQFDYFGSLKICVASCSWPNYLDDDGTCSSAACVYPLVIRPAGPVTFCEPKCSGINIYLHTNGSCLQDCPSPLRQSFEVGSHLCLPPMCGAVVCDACPTLQCKDNYYCDIDLGKYCMVLTPYTIKANKMKPITNGQLITVEVHPQLGLTKGANDYIEFSIEGLNENTDYIYDIIPVDVGVFQVNLTLLKTQESNLNAHFTYSPENLDVQGSTTIPRITFISTVVQKAGRGVGNASQVAFMLFLVSIGGMILGGGLTSLWTSLPDSQYTYYLVYLNVDFLHHTQVYFETLSNYDLLNSNDNEELIIQDVKLKAGMPSKFYTMNYPTDFLENAHQIMTQVGVMAVVLFISFLLQRYYRFPRQLFFFQKFLDYAEGALKWNGIIRQCMAYILPLSTASFIQIYAGIFRKYPINPISMMLAVSLLFLFGWFFAKIFYLIRVVPPTRLERALHAKSFGTLWENLDTNYFTRYYFWLVAFRGLLLSYVCVFIADYPKIQIAILSVFQIVMVGMFLKFIGIRSVFQDSWLNTTTFLEELSILMVKVFIFAFVILREQEAKDSTLILLGWLIIIPGVLTQAMHIIYSVAVQVRGRRKLYAGVQRFISTLKRKKPKKRIRRFVKKLPASNKIQDENLNNVKTTMVKIALPVNSVEFVSAKSLRLPQWKY